MKLSDLLAQQKWYDINSNLLDPEFRILIMYNNRYPRRHRIEDILDYVPHPNNIYVTCFRMSNRLTSTLQLRHNILIVLNV